MKTISAKLATAALFACGTLTFLPSCGNDPVTNINAASVKPRQLATDSRAALDQLYRTNPAAKRLGKSAKGILVFPSITKGGFVVGGMGGNGSLIRPDGKVRDFYQIVGASYGLQIGLQRHGYALFLMDDAALANLNSARGWEIGSSPNLVIVDQGMAATLSTKTLNKGTFAFIFNQRGLMGGIGLQGAKITRIHPPQ
jgi:lipid-binding SYLF domain-containing protein